MKTYLVTTPIAGHLSFEVEAESGDEAKIKSADMNWEDGDLTWEPLEKFHQGNVCYCPTPWEKTAELLDIDD